MSTVSAIIITLNEEKNIARCLDAITWIDEIIVLDSGSTDNTVEIVRKYTDKVYHQDWLGFGPQKNKALSYVTSDWVLWLDADEVVTPELSKSIQSEIINPKNEFYKLLRRSYFLGRILNHGDWGRDWVVRLFKRGDICWSDSQVHESLNVKKQDAKPLDGKLIHHTQESFFQSIDKINKYSTLSAEMMIEKGKEPSFVKAIFRSKMAFFRSYILRAGFLDGVEGYLCAKNIALGAYLKYMKCIFDHKKRHTGK